MGWLRRVQGINAWLNTRLLLGYLTLLLSITTSGAKYSDKSIINNPITNNKQTTDHPKQDSINARACQNCLDDYKKLVCSCNTFHVRIRKLLFDHCIGTNDFVFHLRSTFIWMGCLIASERMPKQMSKEHRLFAVRSNSKSHIAILICMIMT